MGVEANTAADTDGGELAELDVAVKSLGADEDMLSKLFDGK